MIVEAGDIYVAWVKLLERLLASGAEAAPRGKKVKELLGVQLRVRDARRNVIVDWQRKLNYRFLVAEWLWIEAARNDLAFLSRHNSRLREFSDDGVTLAGAYGPRLGPQRGWVLSKLREDPETRQAVASIWTPAPGPSKDIPCTLNLQFLRRQKKLHLVATMRSSDAWLGIPYDFFSFTQYAGRLAEDLGEPLGEAILNLGSSHLYEEHWAAAASIANAPTGHALFSPSRLDDATNNRYQRCLEVSTSAEALAELINLGQHARQP